ncbi:hypothetical protein [Stenotrophomonas sp. PS02301]|nr:hypothetical protein [Stenotrophomonas sp. PS02301]
MPVKKVCSIGERGINTNIVNYDIYNTLVSLIGKGIMPAIRRWRWQMS